MSAIDMNTYTELLDARDKLCKYCENDDCDSCRVTELINDADNEAIEAGLIDEE